MNNRKGHSLVMENIDCAWCNLLWLDNFEHSHLRPTFKFEAMWLIHEDCKSVVTNAWKTPNTRLGSTGFRLVKKLKITCNALQNMLGTFNTKSVSVRNC